MRSTVCPTLNLWIMSVTADIPSTIVLVRSILKHSTYRPLQVGGNWPKLFAAGSANAVDGHRGCAGFFSDHSVLFLDGRAGGSIAVDAAKDQARNSAVGPLGTIFVEHVEHHEFGAGCWFSSHVSVSHCWFGDAKAQSLARRHGCHCDAPVDVWNDNWPDAFGAGPGQAL